MSNDRTPLVPDPKYSTHEKQDAVLASDARYKVLEWGRRAGKNITALIECIEYGRAPWRSRWGRDDPAETVVWWVARSYDQAEKYGFRPMRSALPSAWIDGTPKRSPPYEIRLVNGVTYEFRTYDHPETLQGAGVDRMVVDEADYMVDALWYDDLEPMLMDTTGAAMFISKPVRHRSYFQTLAERGRSADWADHLYSHATSADNPFIDEDPEAKRGTMPDHKYRQQYLAELPDDGGSVFQQLEARLFTGDYRLDGEVVEGTGEVAGPPEEFTEPFSVAVDLARHRDYRVAGALDAEGRLAYYSRTQNEGWDGIFDHVVTLHDTYPGIVVPDATQDNKIISDWEAAGVAMSPTKFSPQRKKELIEDLITAVENGEITAPNQPELDQLALELRMLEREVTASGYTKYHAPEGAHDDTVDMLALAYSGLNDGHVPSTIMSLGTPDSGERQAFKQSDIGQALEQHRRKQDSPWS
jgi:hypothetical protein